MLSLPLGRRVMLKGRRNIVEHEVTFGPTSLHLGLTNNEARAYRLAGTVQQEPLGILIPGTGNGPIYSDCVLRLSADRYASASA